MPSQTRGMLDPLELEVQVVGSESSDVDSGNRTQVLHKQCVLLIAELSLPPRGLTSLNMVSLQGQRRKYALSGLFYEGITPT